MRPKQGTDRGKAKSGLFEKVRNVVKPPARPTSKEKTQIPNIKNERGAITTDTKGLGGGIPWAPHKPSRWARGTPHSRNCLRPQQRWGAGGKGLTAGEAKGTQ